MSKLELLLQLQHKQQSVYMIGIYVFGAMITYMIAGLIVASFISKGFILGALAMILFVSVMGLIIMHSQNKMIKDIKLLKKLIVQSKKWK